MALTINSTSYAGEHALPFVNAAVKTSRTIEAGGVKLMQGIKYKSVIQNLEAANVISDSSCDFPTGFTTSTRERVIEPIELQAALQFCKQDFHDDWLSKYQVKSAMDNVPPTFEMYLLSYLGQVIGSELEDTIWTGNGTGSNGEFDGLGTRILEATDSASGRADQTVTGQQATNDNTGSDIATGEYLSTDKDTVLTAFSDAAALVANRVYSKGPAMLSHYVGFDVLRALIAAYGETNNGQGINTLSNMWWAGGFTGLRHNGINVFVAPGIIGDADNNTNDVVNRGDIYTTYKNNLIVGVGAIADQNQAAVIDTGKYDGGRNVRVIYRFAMGTQVADMRDVSFLRAGAKKA